MGKISPVNNVLKYGSVFMLLQQIIGVFTAAASGSFNRENNPEEGANPNTQNRNAPMDLDQVGQRIFSPFQFDGEFIFKCKLCLKELPETVVGRRSGVVSFYNELRQCVVSYEHSTRWYLKANLVATLIGVECLLKHDVEVKLKDGEMIYIDGLTERGNQPMVSFKLSDESYSMLNDSGLPVEYRFCNNLFFICNFKRNVSKLHFTIHENKIARFLNIDLVKKLQVSGIRTYTENNVPHMRTMLHSYQPTQCDAFTKLLLDSDELLLCTRHQFREAILGPYGTSAKYFEIMKCKLRASSTLFLKVPFIYFKDNTYYRS